MVEKQFDANEQYAVNESQEISIGEIGAAELAHLQGERLRKSARKILSVFPALRYRNYQLYFSGQLVSFIGTWLQNVTQGWLVFQMSHSAFAVGVIAALGSLPLLLFSLWGGVIADRFSQRHLMLWSQIASMICAFALAVLVWLGSITVLEIGALAFILGMASALAYPVSQAFVVALVDRKDLASAIALNSTVFNGARTVGPALAGLSIAIVGAGGTFFFNGLSFIAVIAGLLLMRIAPPQTEGRMHAHPFKAIREGFSYAFSHPIMRTLLILSSGVCVFGWSYSVIMPVIAQTIFHQNAAGLGYLYAAAGLGAFFGALGISFFLSRIDHILFILASGICFAVFLVLFTLTSSMLFAIPTLFFVGLGLTSQFSMINIILQKSVEDHVRGRVMSIYTFVSVGFAPFGNMIIGFLAERFGIPLTLRLDAFIVMLFLIFFFLRIQNLQKIHAQSIA